MKRGVYPGSFDPFTNGHLDIVLRSMQLVDQLTIAVLRNSKKQGLFDPAERVELIEKVIAETPALAPYRERIRLDIFEGLLVEYCRRSDIRLIIRGLRAVSDYDYEHAIFLVNRHMFPELDTVFLMSSMEHSFISSTIVKEVASLGGHIGDQVPPAVETRLDQVFRNSDSK